MANRTIDILDCTLHFFAYESAAGIIPLCRIETDVEINNGDNITITNTDRFACPWTTKVDGQSGYTAWISSIYNTLSSDRIIYHTELDDKFFKTVDRGNWSYSFNFKIHDGMTDDEINEYGYGYNVDPQALLGEDTFVSPVPCHCAVYSTTTKKYLCYSHNPTLHDYDYMQALLWCPADYKLYGIKTYGNPVTANQFGTYILNYNALTGLTSNYGMSFTEVIIDDIQTQVAELFKKSVDLKDLDDPNPGDGDSHGGGGGGTGDLGGDTIGDTNVPTLNVTSSGLMTLYNPTVGELQQLGRFLWSDGLDLSSFKKLFNDPFDTLLGLSIVPIVPPTSGTKNIMFGNLDSGVTAKVISNQFVPAVDMGTLSLNEVWRGALDYSPFTSVSIYLPFIGYRQLNITDVMNSDIKLTYKFDVLTGGCIAELYVKHHLTGNKASSNSKFKWNNNSGLLASFEGQCAVNIPLASQDYTNTIRAMIGAVGMVGGAAASIATGNPALGIAALAVGATNSAIQGSTPTVERSGHLSSSNALMANLTPFLTVTRPHQCKPSKYYKMRGVPSQVYVSKLSELATNSHNYFVQIAEIPDIKVAGATDTEIAEIKQLLKEGVVI